MSIRHVVSVSGGKDSTATLLIALERFGRERVMPIFCDTGNEHAAVYDYLTYLECALGVRIERLRADFSGEFARKRMFIARDQRTGRDDRGRRLRWSNRRKREALAVLQPCGNPFLDLCMLKGRFPSRTAQFCTERLKRDPAVSFQIDLIDAGCHVVSWQGVRRDESQRRRSALRFGRRRGRIQPWRGACRQPAGAVSLPGRNRRRGLRRRGWPSSGRSACPACSATITRCAGCVSSTWCWKASPTRRPKPLPRRWMRASH